MSARAAALVAAMTATACGTAPAAFECRDDGACDARTGGVCETGGRCSYPDGDCASGRRFGDAAGDGANQCVADGGGAVDGGPDAGCGPVDLLVDGSFELGDDAWVQRSTGAASLRVDEQEVDEAFEAADGDRLAWLGGDASQIDELVQLIALPAGATAIEVRGQQWFANAASSPGVDQTAVVIEDAEGDELAVVFSGDGPGDGWQPFTGSVTPPADGGTIALALQGFNDNADPSDFFYDALEVLVTACP